MPEHEPAFAVAPLLQLELAGTFSLALASLSLQAVDVPVLLSVSIDPELSSLDA